MIDLIAADNIAKTQQPDRVFYISNLDQFAAATHLSFSTTSQKQERKKHSVWVCPTQLFPWAGGLKTAKPMNFGGALSLMVCLCKEHCRQCQLLVKAQSTLWGQSRLTITGRRQGIAALYWARSTLVYGHKRAAHQIFPNHMAIKGSTH